MLTRAMEGWSRWIADQPDTPSPDSLTAGLLSLSDWLRQRTTLVDVAIATLLALWTIPQLVYWWVAPDEGFVIRLALTALLVAPLALRRRFPLSTFAFAAAVAFVQWLANVSLAADLALLVYLYTVASVYRTRVTLLAAAVVELGVILAALSWNLGDGLAQPLLQRILILSALVAAAVFLGVGVRMRRQSLAALSDR
ncbi:MAG: hypothetical protein PSX37_03900, partial [bacterium]|nr:hypothetical protein [bacterium]